MTRSFSLALISILPLIVVGPARGQCEEGKLFAPDAGSSDLFGKSLALDGQRMIVGGPQHQADGSAVMSGAAWIFERSGADWSAGIELPYPAPRDEDHFGWSVSLSGDYALVGAPSRDHSGIWNAGVAYAYRWTGSAWEFEGQLRAPDAAMADYFGGAVCVDGDTALIRADDRVFVFERVAGEWQQVDRFDADATSSSYAFGISLALSDEFAFVGDPAGSGSGAPAAGEVWVYKRQAGAWSFQTKLFASDADFQDEFGSAVAVDGSTAVIGAKADYEFGLNSGKAYVFRQDPDTGWDQVTKLRASDAGQYLAFGSSVAVRGDRIVVGAPMHTYHPESTGAAYLFERTSGHWVETAKLVDPAAADDHHFGAAVGLLPDALTIGATGDDGAAIDAGAVTWFDPRGHTEIYCAVNPNSTGSPALIGWQGSTSVSANDLILTVSSCPPTQFGLFYYGPEQLELPFGEGYRCIGGNLVRLPLQMTDATGSASHHIDLQNPPSESARIEPGRTRSFQFWFRDPMGGPSAFNLSNALLATFCY